MHNPAGLHLPRWILKDPRDYYFFFFHHLSLAWHYLFLWFFPPLIRFIFIFIFFSCHFYFLYIGFFFFFPLYCSIIISERAASKSLYLSFFAYIVIVLMCGRYLVERCLWCDDGFRFVLFCACVKPHSKPRE